MFQSQKGSVSCAMVFRLQRHVRAHDDDVTESNVFRDRVIVARLQQGHTHKFTTDNIVSCLLQDNQFDLHQTYTDSKGQTRSMS